jgi:ATP-dependent protease ClpP protease subunit
MTDCDVEWGYQNMQKIQSRKRSLSEVECLEFTNESIAKKKIEYTHPLIYTTGNEVHFSYDNIDKLSIELFIRQITKLVEKKYKNKKSDEKITISYIIDTPGGSVTAALKFVDFISLIKEIYPGLHFVSVITGLVASAGTTIAIVADKRKMTANAHAMIHELSSGNAGRYTQLMSYSKFISELHDKLVNIYMKHNSKCSKEELELLLMKDTWYNAEEYKNTGFVDEIK